MDRLIATTAKDGAYTVTVSGLESWAQAECVAKLVQVHLRQPPEWFTKVPPPDPNLSRRLADEIIGHYFDELDKRLP